MLAAPTVLGVTIVGVLMLVHRPTAFDLELSVDGLSMVAAPGEPSIFLGKTPFARVALHGVEQGRIEGPQISWASEPKPTSSPLVGAIELRRDDRHDAGLGMQLRIDSAKPGQGALGFLDPIRLTAGKRVELGVADKQKQALSFTVIDQPLRVHTSLHRDGEIAVSNARVRSGNASEWVDAIESRLHVSWSEQGAYAELTSVPAGITIHWAPVAVGVGGKSLFLPDQALGITALDFTRRGLNAAARVSTIHGGTLTYVDSPKEKPITVVAGDYLVISDVQNFKVRHIDFDHQSGQFRIKAGGEAASLRSGPDPLLRERTLTWFDWLRSRSWLEHGLALLAWLYTTFIGAKKLLSELHK